MVAPHRSIIAGGLPRRAGAVMGGPQADTDVGCKVFIGAEVVVENGEDHRGSDGAVGGQGSADIVNGTVLDTLQLSSAVGLVNGYFDLLSRGMFTPYVGAGIGFVYSQITRS
jgi:Surface antigen